MFEVIKKIGSDTFRAVEEHSPEICLVGGIVGAVAATVMACKGTIKAKEVLEQAADDLEDVNKVKELAEEDKVEYDGKTAANDKVKIVAQTAMKMVRIYGPSVLLLAGSIGLLISGHKILKKRNLALVAAYEGVSEAYKKYQEQVKAMIGESYAQNLKYNLEEKEIDVDTGKTNKDGSPKTKKKKELVINGNPVDSFSPYCRIFDAGCRNWENDAAFNLTFLKGRQSWWNDVLRTRASHTVFLNEIYEDLGFEKTKAGQVVGWSLKDGETTGDGYIDFGIFNLVYQPNVDFINGYEPVCILDFNVDGVVLDKLTDDEA